MSSLQHLREVVNNIRLINTHEHFGTEEDRLRRPADPMTEALVCYIHTQMFAGGVSHELAAEILNPNGKSLRERWELFKPIWKIVRVTGYGRSTLHAIRGLYGIDDLTNETIEPLAERMRERNAPGLFRWAICEKAGVDICMRTPYGDGPLPALPFVNVMNVDHLVEFTALDHIESLSKDTGISIHTLADLEKAIAARLAYYKTREIVGLKMGFAYMRPIYFEHVTAHEAEQSLSLLFKTPRRPIWFPHARGYDEMRPLQNYLVHRIFQNAEALDLPIQIHTGYQEGWGNTISNGDPALLTNLLIEYPRTKVVLFHIGFPYYDSVSYMARTFQNAYVDYCFTHVATPTLARRALKEMLDAVPCNKIMAFGADNSSVEGTYGHAVIARNNVAAALAEQVDDGFYSMEEAEFIAPLILRENAIELYKLQPFIDRLYKEINFSPAGKS